MRLNIKYHFFKPETAVSGALEIPRNVRTLYHRQYQIFPHKQVFQDENGRTRTLKKEISVQWCDYS